MSTLQYLMPRSRLIERLQKTGWVADAPNIDDSSLAAAVRAYQGFHGLKVDGWAGRITERSLNALRFCGHPDRMDLGARLCKWEKRTIFWTVAGSLPSLADGDLRAAYAQAWSYWQAVCDIDPQFTSSGEADVRMGSGAIDAAGGTLAWSELPCGAERSLKQQYDTGESWVVASNPPPHKIDLVRVAAHEIGHALGIGHIGPGNLLAPTYSQSIRTPQAGDIAEAVLRYGRPSTAPVPEPPDKKYDEFLAVGLLGDQITVIRNSASATAKLQ